MLSFDEFRAIQNRRRVIAASDEKDTAGVKYSQKKSKSGNNKSSSNKKIVYNDFDDVPKVVGIINKIYAILLKIINYHAGKKGKGKGS